MEGSHRARSSASSASHGRISPAAVGPALALILVTLATLVTAACGSEKTLPAEPPQPSANPSATLTRVQPEIFTPRCAVSGCHGLLQPQRNLVLEAGASWKSLVGVTAEESTRLRVSPGHPESSYIVSKLRGDATISGGRMPLGGPYLGPAEIQLVVDWIARGAPDD